MITQNDFIRIMLNNELADSKFLDYQMTESKSGRTTILVRTKSLPKNYSLEIEYNTGVKDFNLLCKMIRQSCDEFYLERVYPQISTNKTDDLKWIKVINVTAQSVSEFLNIIDDALCYGFEFKVENHNVWCRETVN